MKSKLRILCSVAVCLVFVLTPWIPVSSVIDSVGVVDVLALDSGPPEFPDFKLPYSECAGVRWTGGPHQYPNTDTLSTYPAGRGSGLDFSNRDHFEVLAMASGVLEEATCEGYGALGCVVAIKHDIGGSVLVYAHLEQSSVQTVKRVFDHGMSTGTPVWVAQGTIIGKAGNTWGQESIHLHIDLRDGSESCSSDPLYCLPGV